MVNQVAIDDSGFHLDFMDAIGYIHSAWHYEVIATLIDEAIIDCQETLSPASDCAENVFLSIRDLIYMKIENPENDDHVGHLRAAAGAVDDLLENLELYTKPSEPPGGEDVGNIRKLEVDEFEGLQITEDPDEYDSDDFNDLLDEEEDIREISESHRYENLP